jgi:hypothetical protein
LAATLCGKANGGPLAGIAITGGTAQRAYPESAPFRTSMLA